MKNKSTLTINFTKNELKMRKETLHDLLLEFYHQGDANDTTHFINTICELFDYPL